MGGVTCIARSPVTTLIKTKDGFGENGKVRNGSTFSYSMPLQGAQSMGESKEKTQLILCKLESGSLEDSKGGTSDITVGGTFYVQEKEIKDPKLIERSVTPNKFDEVVPCNETEPFKVSAGDCMGYMGLYETATGTVGEKDSKHLLHLEVFTKDDQRFNDFLNNKAKVTAGKQYLKVNKGAKLKIAKNATDEKDVAVTTLSKHYFKDASTPTLKRDWVWEKSKITLSKIEKEEWYKIQIAGLPKETFGWIKKGSSTKEVGQLDLKELGFKVIEETDESTNGDLFVDLNKVSVQGGGEEVKEFFKEIHKEIDNLGRGDGKGDGKLTPDEIQAAYKDEDLRETLQKIIGYHPTEWQKELDPVKVIAGRIKTGIESLPDEKDPEKKKLEEILASTSGDGQDERIITDFTGEANLNNLKQEQDRIKKLVFWDKVSELNTNKVYHFHPVNFIGSLIQGKITVELIDKLMKLVGGTSPWFMGSKGTKSWRENFIETCPDVYKIDKQKFVDLLNSALIRYGMDGDFYTAHFLSQCIVESGYLDSTLEYASGNYYNPGKHPGAESMENTVMGDGPKYKGKGLIQLTWKKNYRLYSEYKGEDKKFVDDPMLIASDMYNAIDASCWYWRFNGNLHSSYKSFDIHTLIDEDKNNVKGVTKAVNGGLNGYDHRLAMFNLIKQEWCLE